MLFWIFFIVTVLFLVMPKRIGVRKVSDDCQWLGVLFITIVGVIRFDVGFDYPGYYNLLTPYLNEVALARFEPICKFLFYAVYPIGWPPLVFILFGLMTYGLTFYILKRYTANFPLAIITYVAFFYVVSLGPIRQGAAMAVVLYSYRYMRSNDFIRFIVCAVIAVMLHKSAAVCLIFPIIYRYFNIKWLVISGIGIFILYGTVIYALGKYFGYGIYLGALQKYENTGGTITRFLFLAINVVLLWLTRKSGDGSDVRKLLYITTFGSLFPFLLGGHLGGRMSWYFMVYLCIAIPNVLSGFPVMVRRSGGMLLACYFALFMYIASNNPMKAPYTPYRTIFSINYETPDFKFSK